MMWVLKHLRGIKSMYVNILCCVRVKRSESKCFRIDSGVRQGYIISPWLFNMYNYTVLERVKMGMERIEVRFLEKGRERGDYLTSFMQMTWFCVAIRKKT